VWFVGPADDAGKEKDMGFGAGEDGPKLGIQLYTLRDLTGEDTFEETLTAVSEMGFQGVEFAWKYGGLSPRELAAFLRSLSLECCGLHVQIEELLDPAHIVYDYAIATGSPFITTSLCSRLTEWDALVPKIETASRIAASKGLVLTYHNHWQEIAEMRDGRDALDLLCENTGVGAVKLELDLGWICRAGREPMHYWRQWGLRTPQVHLRDYDVSRSSVCDVGAGFIHPAAVVSQARELGVEWLIYEQDAYPASPLESCRECVRRMAPVLGL
jgi:sugar phosphate isomerase/epimerase